MVDFFLVIVSFIEISETGSVDFLKVIIIFKRLLELLDF